MALSGKSGVSGGIEIRGSVVGEAVYTAATTAKAVDLLGTSPIGTGVLQAATTAAAVDLLGTAPIGKSILQAATTAAVTNLTGQLTANQLTAYSSAAANYTFIASADSVSFADGNSPSLTITAAGTYLILARADILFNGATFAASRPVTLTLKRINNTAATLANSTVDLQTGVTTTVTQSMPGATWWTVYTTTNTDDIINIQAIVGTVPTAGSLDITRSNIVAYRLQT